MCRPAAFITRGDRMTHKLCKLAYFKGHVFPAGKEWECGRYAGYSIHTAITPKTCHKCGAPISRGQTFFRLSEGYCDWPVCGEHVDVEHLFAADRRKASLGRTGYVLIEPRHGRPWDPVPVDGFRHPIRDVTDEDRYWYYTITRVGPDGSREELFRKTGEVRGRRRIDAQNEIFAVIDALEWSHSEECDRLVGPDAVFVFDLYRGLILQALISGSAWGRDKKRLERVASLAEPYREGNRVLGMRGVQADERTSGSDALTQH